MGGYGFGCTGPSPAFAVASRSFDQGHLIGVPRAVAADGDIFAGDEALLAKAEADLVILLARGIIKVPPAAGFSAQLSDPILFARAETADAAGCLMRLPFCGVETAFRIQRDEKVIAVGAFAVRVALLARQGEAHMPETWGERG